MGLYETAVVMAIAGTKKDIANVMKAMLVKCVTKLSAPIIAIITAIVYQELAVKEFTVSVRQGGRASAAVYQNAQINVTVTATVCMEHATAMAISQDLNAIFHFVPTNVRIMVFARIRQVTRRAFVQRDGRVLTAIV